MWHGHFPLTGGGTGRLEEESVRVVPEVSDFGVTIKRQA